MNATPVHTTAKTILQFRFHYSDITEEHSDVDVENVMADTVNLGRKHSGLMDMHVQVRNERKISDTGYMSITKATTKGPNPSTTSGERLVRAEQRQI